MKCSCVVNFFHSLWRVWTFVGPKITISLPMQLTVHKTQNYTLVCFTDFSIISLFYRIILWKKLQKFLFILIFLGITTPLFWIAMTQQWEGFKGPDLASSNQIKVKSSYWEKERTKPAWASLLTLLLDSLTGYEEQPPQEPQRREQQSRKVTLWVWDGA
jgi:hypothetical protein